MPLDSSRTINAFQAGYGIGDALRQRARKERLAQILARAYDPGLTQEQINQTPEMLRMPDVQAREPSFNFLRATPYLAKEGFAPEAIALQLQLDAPKRELQKILFENALKRQNRKEDLADFQSMFDGNMGAGSSFEYGPQGATIKIDPTKARELSMKEAEFNLNMPAAWRQNLNIGGMVSTATPQGADMSMMSPKQIMELQAKRAEEQPIQKRMLEATNNQIDIAINQIDDLLLDKEGLSRISGPLYGRQWFPNMTERATNTQAKLDSLKDQIAVRVLQQMRDSSKTGGAVGNVTEREWPKLENQLGSLTTVQSPEQLAIVLGDIRKILDDAKTSSIQSYMEVYKENPLQGQDHNKLINSKNRRINDRRQNVIDFSKLPVDRGR